MENQMNCDECGMLDHAIDLAGKEVFVRNMRITDLIFHRYHEHGIIPLQEKYVSLRNGQEEWYDEQVRKGHSDDYKWLSQAVWT